MAERDYFKEDFGEGEKDFFAEDFAEPSAEQPDIPQSNSSLGAKLIGTAAVGIPALLGAKALRRFIQPFSQKAPIEQQFESWRQQLGLQKGQSPEFITGRIQERVPDIKTEYANKVQTVKSTSKLAVDRLTKNINDFDQTILKSSVEDMTNMTKTAYPKFLENGYGAYEQMLSANEDALVAKNISFSGEDFKTNVINKTINYAKSKGYQPDQIAPLQKLGKGIKEGSITLTRAKGHITTLASQEKLPNNLIRVMRENWGSELERVAPPEIQASLKAGNSAYKPFAEVRNALENVIDPRTGQADNVKLYGYIKKYATTQQETGISRVMDILKKDFPEVGKGFEKLKGVAVRRQARVDAPLKAKINQSQRLQSLFKEAQQKLQSAQSWAKKAEEANDRLDVLNARIGKRKNVARAYVRTGSGTGISSRLMGAMPIMGIASDAMNAIGNTEQLKGMSNDQIFMEWMKQQNMPMGGEI